MLADKGEISALKLRHGRKIRPSNYNIVESNDPSCLIDVCSRFHPENAVDWRIGPRGSNGYRRTRFEVAAFPFFDLGFENTDLGTIVVELARPAQLLATGL